MIKYEIEGGNLPVLICYPEAGQSLCTESGAMSWMSANTDNCIQKGCRGMSDSPFATFREGSAC